jgi:hypothetical protein
MDVPSPPTHTQPPKFSALVEVGKHPNNSLTLIMDHHFILFWQNFATWQQKKSRATHTKIFVKWPNLSDLDDRFHQLTKI